MMIEDEQRAGDRWFGKVIAEQMARSAVMNQRRVKAQPGRNLAPNLVCSGQKAQPLRNRVGVVQKDLFAEQPQSMGTDQHRAERIPIQSRVRTE